MTTTTQEQTATQETKYRLCELSAYELNQQRCQIDQQIRSLRARTGHLRRKLTQAREDLDTAQYRLAALQGQQQSEEGEPPRFVKGQGVLLPSFRVTGIVYDYLPERAWPYHVVFLLPPEEAEARCIPASDGAYGIALTAEEMQPLHGPLNALLLDAYRRRRHGLMRPLSRIAASLAKEGQA